MEIARAALGNHADLSARCAAIFSRIAGGEYLHLRGRIHIGYADAGAVRARAHHWRAVEGLHALLAARTVHVERVVEAEAKRRHRIVAYDARLHLCEVERVASIKLDVLDLLLSDQLAYRSALGLNGVDARLNSHFGCGVADLHGDVDAAADVGVDVHVAKGCRLEACCLDANGVVAGRQDW